MTFLNRGQALAYGLLLTLGGCAALTPQPASQQPAPPQSQREYQRQPAPAAPDINLSGYPKAFQEGYADGCSSAKSGSIRQNPSRFKVDEQYTQGWRDGYDVCKRR